VLDAQRDLVRVPLAESRPQRQVVAEVETSSRSDDHRSLLHSFLPAQWPWRRDDV